MLDTRIYLFRRNGKKRVATIKGDRKCQIEFNIQGMEIVQKKNIVGSEVAIHYYLIVTEYGDMKFKNLHIYNL